LRKQMQRFEGIAASAGIAIGTVLVYRPATIAPGTHRVVNTDAEIARFHGALLRAREQLGQVRETARATMGQGGDTIFEAQQLMLENPALLEAVETRIRSGENAEAALAQEVDRFAAMLANLQDAYLRERAADVRDVGQRVLRNLAGVHETSLADLSSPSIIIALDLTPCETVQMNRTMALGFATVRGGTTSHTAILAKSLGLPAVVGLDESVLKAVQDSTAVIVDGNAGVLVVDPDQVTLNEYCLRQAHWQASREAAHSTALSPAVTRDGHRVEVVANLGDAGSAETALAFGAEGVGLLRTEFLFLNRDTMPDEDEQYATYRSIASAMGPSPLVIRTLDVGGDKSPPCLDLGEETNPFLGFRAIRVSLAHPELFKAQLRAILRAAVNCNVKIMFPMVATIEEVRSARKLLEEARQELKARGATFPAETEVGIMVEVPSAALSVPILAQEVDFFSLGTNDLIQYTLAVDRTNERVGSLYDPLHPAILHLIKKVINDVHCASKWVSMCGEMAGDKDAIPLLLGMGLDEFSVNPASIPEAKALIHSLDLRAMQVFAARALELSTAAEIRALVRREDSL
jgi:phosphotransferase system enzyme I (PtsI)